MSECERPVFTVGTMAWVRYANALERENAALKRENEALVDFKDEVEAVLDLMYQYTMRRLTEQEPE